MIKGSMKCGVIVVWRTRNYRDMNSDKCRMILGMEVLTHFGFLIANRAKTAIMQAIQSKINRNRPVPIFNPGTSAIIRNS